ncbi:MAG: hypothetical protein FIA99_06590 [Ruminiclostridium sp.]|nr:hypothetical protein [Ruminiclostridium sp.]
MKKIIILFILIALIAGGVSACSNVKPDGRQNSTQDNSSESAGTGDMAGGKTSDSGDNNSPANNNGKEAKYYPNAVEGYKTAYNEAFDFWFDLPEGWKAVDKSKNGDGYFIIPDAADMDVRVYGLLKETAEEEYYRKLAGNSGKIEDFTFNDGESGKKIQNNSRVYFVRVDGDTYICFYVNYKDNTTWYQQNSDKLTNIAMSLRTRMEGPKLDSGANKISLDDLKLGEIYIDMAYENVKKTMKAKLIKEETGELGGTTLFYDDGTEIYIIDDTVYTMNVNSESYSTPKGLKVGDGKDRVRELYGEPDNTEDDTHWGYTYDGYELFSIVFKDDKVSELQIDMVR